MLSDDSFKGKSLIDYLVIFDPQQRINILYLISAFALALISYWTFRKDKDVVATDTGFKNYIFPKGVYTHKSAIQDYAFALANVAIYYVLIAQLMVTASMCATVMHQVFGGVFGVPSKPVLAGPVSKIIFTICSILAFDFALFWQHYLMHKIPILWHFHKVHHSAEVLTPVTLYRMHPVDLMLSGFLAAVIGGTFYGLYWYLSNGQPQEYVVLGLNVITFLFYIFGYNLRHSQVWFNYPAWVSHIFVSPAQHQVHHSTQPKHFDRNMGLIFAFWDKLFGTLYVPQKFEKLEYGISRKEPNPFPSVWDLYVMPFKWSWASLKDKKERDAIAPLALFIVITGLFFGVMYQTIQAKALQSVNIEDLTWVEIDRAMHDGYDTVIIPVGGTEQNGAHMVIGKHNYIIHYTADRIAEKIGRAFVAPVMAYVPEGRINPPDDNMYLPGTVSLPEEDFAAVLRAAAQSYIQHGFKYIFFIGEHGLDQKEQEKIAAELNGKNAVVASIGDYYYKNGQIDWLTANGFTTAEIGTHAGIRDTSEMLFVRPEGVRSHPPGQPGQLGNNGDYRLANRWLGEKMITLKIDAAIRQIMPYLKNRADPVKILPVKKPAATQKKETIQPGTSDG